MLKTGSGDHLQLDLLRSIEELRIKCGKWHFKIFDEVQFKMVSSLTELVRVMIAGSKYDSYARSSSYAELSLPGHEDISPPVKLTWIVCSEQRDELGLFWGRIGIQAKKDGHFVEVCF